MWGLRTKLVVVCASLALCSAGSMALAGQAFGYSIWPIAGFGTPCGTPPDCGDGGTGTSALLAYPIGVALDKSGNAYIADWGDNEVRKLGIGGRITTIAGSGTTCSAPPKCGDGGAATRAALSFPDGVAVDQSGNVYIADTLDNEVRKVAPGGRITRFAGNGTPCASPPDCGDGAAATAAQLSSPFGVAVDKQGNVYIGDAGDNEIREVTPAGTISRIAGTGEPCPKPPGCGDGATATSAQLNFPAGVAVDGAGNVYVADDGDNEVRRFSPGGAITRIAGTGAVCASAPACGDGGPATSATLGGPDGVAVDQQKNVYIADGGDNEVRKIGVRGTIARIAGNGTPCAVTPGCGNGGLATSAQLNYPDAVAVDPLGNVYAGDTFDNQLRLLSAARGSSVATSSGTAGVLALTATVAASSVTVRYVLSLPAAITLSVARSGGSPTVVARATGKPGWALAAWNRQLGGAPAGRGTYRLTVTATVGGKTLTSSLRVRL
jgi:trimeric autotransporter adhesin